MAGTKPAAALHNCNECVSHAFTASREAGPSAALPKDSFIWRQSVFEPSSGTDVFEISTHRDQFVGIQFLDQTLGLHPMRL